MKRVVFCAVLITVVMAVSLTGTFIVRKTADEIKSDCENILIKYKNYEDVSSDIKTLYEKWNDKSGFLCLIVSKDKLDKMAFTLSEMLDTKDMERGNFISSMNSAIYYIDDIAEDETPKFKNIF